MKKTILLAGLAILLAATPLMAQMMGGGQMMGNQNPGETQQMMQQQERQPTVPADEQNNPQYMTPCMLGGYGYGMGPGMMGGHGRGMGPGIMGGGYGYGMGMMGDYGYGMGPGMMGGYGHGMEPCMMGYYTPEQYEKHYRENQTFLDATKELRKKLHTLKFDYAEARRNPATKREDLEKMNAEMENLWKQIYEKRKSLSE